MSVSKFQSEDSGEHPCVVCRRGDDKNSILCVECLMLVHQKFNGISGKLKSNVDFYCKRCLEAENDLRQSVLLKELVTEPNSIQFNSIQIFARAGSRRCEIESSHGVGMYSQVLLFGRHNLCRRRCRGGCKSQCEICLG